MEETKHAFSYDSFLDTRLLTEMKSISLASLYNLKPTFLKFLSCWDDFLRLVVDQFLMRKIPAAMYVIMPDEIGVVI